MKSYPLRLLDSLIINDFGSSQCLRFFVEREPLRLLLLDGHGEACQTSLNLPSPARFFCFNRYKQPI